LIIGGPIFCVSFFQCIEIVKINNEVHQAKNRPNKLLMNGYYAKVRHPMTTRFFFISLSFFFMFCSLIAIPIILLLGIIFGLITLYEEKKILFPLFDIEYEIYQKKVKFRFFTRKMKFIVFLLIIEMLIGSIFI